MRVAIPVTKGQIPNHLGHSERFFVADVVGNTITRTSEVDNPGHGPGGPPPVFLVRMGVTHVLAWGVPPHARGIFADAGVELLRGVTGAPEDALTRWLAGTLTTTTEGLDAGGGCGRSPHDHHDDDAEP